MLICSIVMSINMIMNNQIMLIRKYRRQYTKWYENIQVLYLRSISTIVFIKL